MRWRSTGLSHPPPTYNHSVAQHLPQPLLIAHDPLGELRRDLELDRQVLVHGVDLLTRAVAGAASGAVRGAARGSRVHGANTAPMHGANTAPIYRTSSRYSPCLQSARSYHGTRVLGY